MAKRGSSEVEMTVNLITRSPREDGLELRDPQAAGTVGAEASPTSSSRGPWPRETIVPVVTLACTECKRRNYVTVKNRLNDRDRIELKKYLPLGTAAHAPPRDQVATFGRSASAELGLSRLGGGPLPTLPRRIARTSASIFECTRSFVEDVLRVGPKRIRTHGERHPRSRGRAAGSPWPTRISSSRGREAVEPAP